MSLTAVFTLETYAGWGVHSTKCCAPGGLVAARGRWSWGWVRPPITSWPRPQRLPWACLKMFILILLDCAQSRRPLLEHILSCYGYRILGYYLHLFCDPMGRPWDFPGKNIAVGCHFLLWRIFPTQESNPCLLHHRRSLLSESPGIEYSSCVYIKSLLVIYFYV